MSVEISVLFHGTLPAKAKLTRAMKELGFPLTISPPAGSLEKQSGFMPMRLRREETGVEFDVFTGRADIEDMTQDLAVDIDPRFDRSANFRWGGDENEMLCGMCAAAALAKLVNGVVLDDDGESLSVDEAIVWATKHLREATPPAKRGATRPADIKRYLKALLKERSDLALVGRLLVIKPVRHILRGAYFESHRKDKFRIWSHVNPLYAPAATTYGDHRHVAGCHTWEPHFEPLLIDALAEDVFAQVGRILSLADFAAQSYQQTPFLSTARTLSLVLAGERDRAAAYVEQVEKDEENEYFKGLVRKGWERVSGDVETICATYHAREAAAVKDLQLEHIWEPSPFPVEVPAAERERRTAEPLFVPKPWVARPEWLLRPLPEHPGEVQFAQERLFRRGHVFMLAALSREEAEDRHRNSEPYVLATRLPDEPRLWLRWDGTDRDDPWRVKYPRTYEYICLRLGLVGGGLSAEADFQMSKRREGMLELYSVEVLECATRRTLWRWWFDRHEQGEAVQDNRSGDAPYSTRELTNAEVEQFIQPWPGFGEFDVLVAMVRKVLRSRGYGEIR
jgi:hypothetical protein